MVHDSYLGFVTNPEKEYLDQNERKDFENFLSNFYSEPNFKMTPKRKEQIFRLLREFMNHSPDFNREYRRWTDLYEEVYVDGIESNFFNFCAAKTKEDPSQLPVLGGKCLKSLSQRFCQDNFITTRYTHSRYEGEGREAAFL